jgi:magnesium-dependent phosphatase 1
MYAPAFLCTLAIMKSRCKHLPKLVVFDLDLTLWECGGTWIDCSAYPFTRNHDGKVWDSRGGAMTLYPDVFGILDELRDWRVTMSLASRTAEPGWARELLHLLDINDLFNHPQIYPGDKNRHFRKLHKQLHVAYEDMIFFDDESRNIRDVSEMGVQSHLVHRGLTRDVFEHALRVFDHARQSG